MSLLETALAFALAMLAASLFVSAGVQLVQRIGKYRANGLRELMQSLIDGFRTYHNDPDADPVHNPITDAWDDRFLHDLFTDPALYSRGEGLDQSTDLDKQSMLDELSADDLVGIVYNYARYYQSIEQANPQNSPSPVAAAREPSTVRAVAGLPLASSRQEVSTLPPVDVPLPIEWVGGSVTSRKVYATASNFAAYTGRWFPRLELNATQRFRTRAFRLTGVIAATVVIAFCLDGFQLIRDIYSSSNSRDSLIAQRSSLEASAARMGAVGPILSSTVAADTNRQLLGELQKTATILDQANLGIGWPNSRIVMQWCAYEGRCDDSAPPNLSRILFETLLWIAGMFFSFAMLMLGAPFWYRALSSLTTSASGGAGRRGAPPPATQPQAAKVP